MGFEPCFSWTSHTSGLRDDTVLETKVTLKVVRTRVQRVLLYSKTENATLCSLPWTQAVNFISKGTMFCSYAPTTDNVLQLRTSNRQCFAATHQQQTMFCSYTPATDNVLQLRTSNRQCFAATHQQQLSRLSTSVPTLKIWYLSRYHHARCFVSYGQLAPYQSSDWVR